ncbi:hypothetical protein POPTR_009G020201v4 [Populus trichocarpa]|uniref:Uncharacterized protein n=1 Tax=Populus trichocarpa TaxID=3694 RepID=A0ACC0SG23_POPTR|nr:hypothetical protein BDE02_09G014800 [Populus trichocarpa]KAI9388157.1 hypothetical protein POPTR_009G020201v4 [Populus trichocarpa]
MFAELKKLLHDLKEEGTLLHDLTVCRVCRAFDIEIRLLDTIAELRYAQKRVLFFPWRFSELWFMGFCTPTCQFNHNICIVAEF